MARLIFFAISYLIVAACPAQVSGRVSDASGEPLIGATVSLKGTTQGTITDLDGNYTIEVDEGVLVFFLYRL